ncbi:MAG TPA: NYN domain-containing protein [Actinomycetota bacterium]|nr:NYN domain-containing protein [Actinomycetota bacterium]
MGGITPEAESALLRGLGAYLRDIPRNELPTRLRPFAGRHQKMLVARKKEVLAALDDDALRALIVQWLDDDPPLKRAEADILRTAAERSDGWEDALASKVARPERAAPATEPDLHDAIAREKKKARKARDDARRAREDLDRAVQESKARLVGLQEELATTRAELSATRKELLAAAKEAARARAELDREVRKARRRVTDAENDAKRARKDLQRALRDLERARTPSLQKKKRPRSAPHTTPEPKKRRPLPVPKGRFQDAPETLRSWLEAPSVHLLVDGYNVSKARDGYAELELEKQRERVIEGVGNLARRHSVKATIVFDGSDIAPGAGRRPRGPVAVEYSRAGEIADDHLVARLEALPKHPVIVVTNDRELQGRAAALGATIATSDQLLALIRA